MKNLNINSHYCYNVVDNDSCIQYGGQQRTFDRNVNLEF